MTTLSKDMNNKELEAFRRVWKWNASKKDIEALGRLYSYEHCHTQTLAEYVAETGCKTEERTSKRGVHLTKVYFPSGRVQEFETEHMTTTYAFQK